MIPLFKISPLAVGSENQLASRSLKGSGPFNCEEGMADVQVKVSRL